MSMKNRLEENIKLCFGIWAWVLKIPVTRDRSQWRVGVKKVMILPTAYSMQSFLTSQVTNSSWMSTLLLMLVILWRCIILLNFWSILSTLRFHMTWIFPSLNSGTLVRTIDLYFNPLNAELNPICYLLALLAHHFLHVSRIRVKSLTLRLLMSYIYIYIYGAPILDVSRSHTTTQHSR